MRTLRIGFIPFYVDYYEGICPDFPREKAQVASRCAERLRPHGKVLWDGQLIKTVDAAEERGRALRGENPDVVVVVTTIAVFGGIAWAALEQLGDVPVLLWNAQQIEGIGAGYAMVDIVRNTGQIGIQALANTLLRKGRTFKVVSGYDESPRTAQDLERYFRIVGAATALKHATLLAVGSEFPMMTDVELDDGYLREHLGASVTRVSAEDFTRCYRDCSAEMVTREIGEARKTCEVSNLTDDEMTRSARISVALDTLTERHAADAGTLNCHVGNCLRNPDIGVTACFALGIQNDRRGRPFTCTGDLPTALAMLLAKRLTGIAMYTEVQVMDEKRGAIVIANSGEGESGICRQGAPRRVIGNTNFKGTHGRGASFAYPLQSGPATLLSLTPTPSGPKAWRLVVASGEILNDTLPDTGSLAGFFRFSGADLRASYTRWLEAGPVHHAATTIGHHADDMREVAAMIGAEFLLV